MSSDFVRYTPEIETIDPDYAQGLFADVDGPKLVEDEPGSKSFDLMELRRIYAAWAKVCRTLKHQPQTEPNSADEVLA